MRVTIVASHYPPENTAASNRLERLAHVLSASHQVSVFALGEKGVDVIEHEASADGVEIRRIRQTAYPGAGFVRRAANELRFAIRIARAAAELPRDAVIVSVPYMFLLPAVQMLVRAPLRIVDIRDLVWEYVKPSGAISAVALGMLRRFMARQIDRYSHVVVTNPTEREWIRSYTRHEPAVVSNGISRKRFELLARNVYQTPAVPTVTYVGNLGIAQNLGTLLRAAAQMPEARFNVVGDGAQAADLRRFVEANQLTNVTMLGKLSWEELLPVYAASSCLYAQLTHGFETAVPSKLYEYLSTGLPVVYGGTGAAADFLSGFDDVAVVPSDDPDALVNAVRCLMAREQGMAEANRRRIQDHWIREHALQQFERMLDNGSR